MQVYDARLKRNVTVFKEYELNGAQTCPECKRPFKDYDLKRLEESGRTRCVKCGAKLKK